MKTISRGYSGFNPDQTSLFHIETSVVQERLKHWHEQILGADLRKTKAAQAAITRIRMVVVQAHEQGYRWTNADSILAILDLPLGIYRASDLDVQPAPEETILEGPNDTVWSEKAIIELHEHVLIYSLNLLNSKGNALEKRRTLEWIWADDVYEMMPVKRGLKTLRIPLRADQIPFSFQTCCRLSGFHYGELREGLAWAMRDSLKKLGFQPRK